MAQDSRTGRYTAAQPVDFGPHGIRNDAGELIGQIWSTPHGWFAAPRDSQITTIPCDTRAEATATVKRLG